MVDWGETLRATRRRSVLVTVGAIVAGAAAMASCALEGDVFTMLPDGGAPSDTGVPVDSATDAFDATLDTIDTDPWETDLDGAWIHCFPDAPCQLATQQCCVYASLDPFCTPTGTCSPDGAGVSECDRAAQCEAGNLCCDLPAAFTSYGKCLPGPCPGVQRCESNGECADGGHCHFTSIYPTCTGP
jgi:hypothetical protein